MRSLVSWCLKVWEFRNLFISDWKEARRAFHNELYKATVVLCGSVLGALLIDALSHIREGAKFSYSQTYSERKRKGNKPPEIEEWPLYRLIEVAKQQSVITSDVAKLSHIYREGLPQFDPSIGSKKEINCEWIHM